MDAVRGDSSDYTKPSLSTRNLYFGTRHLGDYSAFLSTALRLLCSIRFTVDCL
jgi:hypothetical protein